MVRNMPLRYTFVGGVSYKLLRKHILTSTDSVARASFSRSIRRLERNGLIARVNDLNGTEPVNAEALRHGASHKLEGYTTHVLITRYGWDVAKDIPKVNIPTNRENVNHIKVEK
jgi:hypothetical protein